MFVPCDDEKCAEWEESYNVVTIIPKGFDWNIINKKKTAINKALVHFLSRVQKTDVHCIELIIHMSDQDKWDYSLSQPVMSEMWL